MGSFRRSPVSLFLQVVATVFVAEAGVMFVLPWVLPEPMSGALRALADSCLLTLFSAPLLWIWIVRPLRRVAVTERAKADALSAVAPEGIITFDDRGVVESFSPGAEQIFGCPADEIIGGDLGALIPWHFLARHERSSASEAGPPRPLVGTVKILGWRKDGSEVPLGLSIGEVRVAAGPLYTAVVRNLIDRERDEMRAEQMAAVAQLGTALAHHLRNPLTSVKMLVQAGRRADQSAALDGDDLRIIEEEIRRMEGSLQMFLEFVHPRQPDCRRVALASLAAEAIAVIQPRARQKNIAIRWAQRDEHAELNGDPAQLRQVLVHLLQNAVDATPPRGAVDVDWRRLGEGRMEVLVLDAGPGIPPELFSRLFQPFVTTKATGIGLGLAVSRRVIEEHGGSLSACNRPEGGACFRFSLPGDTGRST